MLAVIPEHPAARQARAKAWQQIAAIGPSGTAQWPQRGARTAQAAALMGLASEPEGEGGAKNPPVSGKGEAAARTRGDLPAAPAAGNAEAEGIVWLAATGNSDSPAVAPKGRPVPPRPLARGRGRRPQGPLPALGRCRGRLPGLP